MKIRVFLLTFLAFATLSAAAQEGGIKGVVISRAYKATIDDVMVKLATTPSRTTYTEADGTFEFRGVVPGIYRLQFEAGDFQPLEMSVRVGSTMVDLGYVSLASDYFVEQVDDADFAEFDTESVDVESMPMVLSASKDMFDNIAGYKFSAMRFRPRGYDAGQTGVYLNGIYFNDAMSGYTPWSLWSGLNDATRNQELSSGLDISDYGVGATGGTTNINARASQMRKGFRASVVNANNMYRYRLMLSYASGENDKGWSYALMASTRQGRNDWVKGVYYNSWAYFASVEKRMGDAHRLAFTFFGAPTERGAQMASTQEVYDLVGSNQYNANWGYQGDGFKNKNMRNARVRNSHEPIAMLNYFYQPSEKFNLQASVSYRFGQNGYSALDWYDAPDPRPDYYRYLPSYFDDDPWKAAWAREGWLSDWNIRQVNWNRLYNVNYNSSLNQNIDYWGNPVINDQTTRSKYVIEERHTDQRDFNAKLQVVSVIKGNHTITGGVEFRWNKTEYYKKIKDLLGGDYWLDVDQFAERDFGSGNAIQNNMNTPNRLVKKGDKYGYDYYGHLMSEKLWATYRLVKGHFEGYLGLEGGHTMFWREGLYRKGLFPDNSEGDSKKQKFWTYTAKAGLTYKITGSQLLYANVGYLEQAPYFQNAFVSPRTRNTVVPGLTTEKVFSADLNYAIRFPWMRLRLTGYYTQIKDRTDLISFYDDLQRAYTNFSMNGIDEVHTGLEVGVSVPLIAGIEAQGALSYGYYAYTSNPYVTQTVDNSEQVVLQNERVYWKDMRVPSTPQTALSIGLNYRGPHNIYAGIDVNYYNAMYLDMNPLYRTDQALINYDMFAPDVRERMIQEMGRQEQFDDAFVLNANFSKSWYIGSYNLGFSLEVKNLLNDKNIKTGGYEQMRLKKNELNGKTYYTRFDSKYFYMFGTTYYLNIYFRF